MTELKNKFPSPKKEVPTQKELPFHWFNIFRPSTLIPAAVVFALAVAMVFFFYQPSLKVAQLTTAAILEKQELFESLEFFAKISEMNLTDKEGEWQAPKEGWKSLSQEQKTKALENYGRWKNLKPQHKRRLLESYQRFQKFSPQTQKKVMSHYQQFQKLSPEKKILFKSHIQEFIKLSPSDRKKKLKKLELQLTS